jgi:hypothetical protein
MRSSTAPGKSLQQPSRAAVSQQGRGSPALPAGYLEVPSSPLHVLGLLVVYTASTASDRDTSCLSGVTHLSCHHHHARHTRIEGGPCCTVLGHNLVWNHSCIFPPISRYLERHWHPVHRLPLTILDHSSQPRIFKLLDFNGASAEVQLCGVSTCALAADSLTLRAFLSR